MSCELCAFPCALHDEQRVRPAWVWRAIQARWGVKHPGEMEEASGNKDMLEIIRLKPNLESLGRKAENVGVRINNLVEMTTH